MDETESSFISRSVTSLYDRDTSRILLKRSSPSIASAENPHLFGPSSNCGG